MVLDNQLRARVDDGKSYVHYGCYEAMQPAPVGEADAAISDAQPLQAQGSLGNASQPEPHASPPPQQVPASRAPPTPAQHLRLADTCPTPAQHWPVHDAGAAPASRGPAQAARDAASGMCAVPAGGDQGGRTDKSEKNGAAVG